MRSIPLPLLLVTVLTSFSHDHVYGQQADNSDGTAVEATIRNVAGDPVAGAEVSLLEWKGVWKVMDVQGTTDKRGKVELEPVPRNTYLGLAVKADGYAATMQEFELGSSERRKLSFKLARPVRGWLDILTPDGEPVAGAEIQRLDFTDPGGSKVVVTSATAAAIHGELLPSDKSGRLYLPEMPEGAHVTIWAIHPDWKLAMLDRLTASSGLLATAKFQPGVNVRVELASDMVAIDAIESQVADVRLLPLGGGSSRPEAVLHSFTVRDGAVEFTAYETAYSTLALEFDDYFATPVYQSNSQHPDARLDLADGRDVVLPMLIRPKRKVQGRIVDSRGAPVRDIVVTGLIANLHADGKSRGDGTSSESDWAFAGNARTNAEGLYEIELAAGRVGVEVLHEGVFPEPSWVEVDIPDTEPRPHVPPITLHPVPKLRGTVLTMNGKPLGGAVVRMRSTGYGPVDPVALTNDDGTFELVMSRIPYASGGRGLETDVFVVAFDPRSRLAGRTSVDLTDPAAVSQIDVRVQPRPSS